MKNRKVKNLILKSGADFLIPFMLVFGFAVILHGQLSPGGGFQGGVIVAGAVLLLFIGYGTEATAKILKEKTLKKHEALAAILYIGIGLSAIFFGVQFCANYLFDWGEPGRLISSGTIMLMNYAVGYKVLTGISCLLLTLTGFIYLDHEYKKVGGGDK